MFRSKRSALIKRLSRLRIVGDEASRSLEDDLDHSKSMMHSILKRLKEVQLEALLQTVESRGAEEPGSCILVPKGEPRLGRRTATCSPHILCCQLWRWPDLRQPYELRRLGHLCETSDSDSLYICCNPYHWSRLCKPDSPPPPYSRHPQEVLTAEDRAPSEIVSQETCGTNLYGSFQSHVSGCVSEDGRRPSKPWCNIAYWELSTRVGRLFPVFQPFVNVFADLPHGDGLCLGTLAQGRYTDNASILQTRTKIGFGVNLCRNEHEVWLYNRSEYPVFVNSPTLDPPNTRRLTVYKILPGFSIKIFDYEKCKYNKLMQDPDQGPFDPHAVRISFAKGWGTSKYSRQFITSCPCWLEVIFMVNR